MSLNVKINNAVCGLTYEIPFGKYKGYTVGNVLEINPQWLIWAHDNIQGFKLCSMVLSQAKEYADEIENERHDYLSVVYESENFGNRD